MPVFAAVVVFGSLVLFGIWFLRSKNQMEDRVRALSSHRRALAEQDDPFTERIMLPTVAGAVTRVLDVLPTSLIGRARKWLIISDSKFSLPTFMTIVLVATTALPVLVFLSLYSQTGGSLSTTQLLLVLLAAVFGFLVPMMLLRSRAKKRQQVFWKSLPDSLDLLTTCVEAGLSLDFAFQRVSERQKGPVGQELSRMLREKALGQTRKEALTAMAERIALQDVNVFVNSVIQAENLGTSIGAVLRVQGRQLRIRRRQRAEQMARQAAPKMVFPLVFFVMPSLFIVVLGPIVLNAIDKLG